MASIARGWYGLPVSMASRMEGPAGSSGYRSAPSCGSAGLTVVLYRSSVG